MGLLRAGESARRKNLPKEWFKLRAERCLRVGWVLVGKWR